MSKSNFSKSKLTVHYISLQMCYDKKFRLSCFTVAVIIIIIIITSINFQLFVLLVSGYWGYLTVTYIAISVKVLNTKYRM